MKKIVFNIYMYLKRRYLAFKFRELKKNIEHIGKNTYVNFPANIYITNRRLSIGDSTIILKNSRIQNFISKNCDSPSIIIGNRCFIGYYCTILNASEVTIGDDVLIASHVMISSENHGIDPESEIPYMDQPLVSKPVSIGDGCWIGEKVCILPGVAIGKKCVIGAGSVVTKSIPDYSMAAGNPAKVIKRYNFKTHNWEKV